MSQETFNLILMLAPLASPQSMLIKSTMRPKAPKARFVAGQSGAAVRTGFFARYVLNPPLWAIVRFCNWPDGFAHRGAKNGTGVAGRCTSVGL